MNTAGAQATFDLADEGATAALARGVARALEPGDVVLLRGEMGAGKTTFARALAGALGVEPRAVASPTFVVMMAHEVGAGGVGVGVGGRGIRRVVHVDAYRVRDESELANAGWDAEFDEGGGARVSVGGGGGGGGAVAMIEWPERIAGAISWSRCVEISLEATGVESRRVTIRTPAEWGVVVGDGGAGGGASGGANGGATAVGRAAWGRVLTLAPIRCGVTGEWVEATSESYPFASERARGADLYRWMSGRYQTSRPVEPEDEVDAG